MNISSILKKQYPENSTGGQCGVFAHRLITFPNVGDTYASKKKAVDDNGIRAGNYPGAVEGQFRVGDVVVTSDGTDKNGKGAGHVCVVESDEGTSITVVESNFKKDGKVHHGRTIPKDSPKIYGVIRGNYKFKLPAPNVPIELKVTVFMQYQKAWKNKAFVDLENWFFESSGGRIKLTVIPLYTYQALKNWWYAAYGTAFGDFYNVVALEYIKDMAYPLRFPDSNIVIWSINKQQFQGTVFNRPELQEIGWCYPQTNPIIAMLCCEEADDSPINPGMQLFVDASRHEIMHGLYPLSSIKGRDLTHERHFGINGYPKDFNKVWDDVDFSWLQQNIKNN